MSKQNRTKLSNGITLIVTFDWLRIELGNGRGLTVGRSGEKATGDVPGDVFQAWIEACRKGPGGDLEGRVKVFANETLDKVWPAWNKAPVLPEFKVGSKVKYDFGSRKGGVDVGAVYKIPSTTTLWIQWEKNGTLSMPAGIVQMA